jgi:hypothetical protein
MVSFRSAFFAFVPKAPRKSRRVHPGPQNRIGVFCSSRRCSIRRHDASLYHCTPQQNAGSHKKKTKEDRRKEDKNRQRRTERRPRWKVQPEYGQHGRVMEVTDMGKGVPRCRSGRQQNKVDIDKRESKEVEDEDKRRQVRWMSGRVGLGHDYDDIAYLLLVL